MIESILHSLPEGLQTPRILLELLADYRYQRIFNAGFEETLDFLAQELDLGEMAVRAQKDLPINQLFNALQKNQIQIDKMDQLLPEFSSYWGSDPQLRGIYYPPEWLINSILLLMDPSQAVLFINAGNSTLIPQYLAESSKKYDAGIDFIAVEHNRETLDNLRLMISLVEEDLDKIRSSILLLPENLDLGSGQQLDLLENGGVDVIPGEFGTIYVDLFSPSIKQSHMRAEFTQNLPTLLNEKLGSDGRAIINGPSNLLDGQAWSKLRASLLEKFHLEGIADFSFAESIFLEESYVTSAFITLRKPQQAITKQITLFTPADFSGFDSTAKNPLQDLVESLGRLETTFPSDDKSDFTVTSESKSTFVFERPFSELVNRWDVKYYCPARQKLQNNLIDDPNATWLGTISEVVAHGVSPSILRPYASAEVKSEIRIDNILWFTPLKVGEEVWLGVEQEESVDLEKVRVERRSGTLIGYLLPKDVPQFSTYFERTGERYPATITKIDVWGENLARTNVIIQFIPPEIYEDYQPVILIRPRDIQKNQLTGEGEQALIRTKQYEISVRLQANDLLFYFEQGTVYACIVPNRMDGAICHQDLWIIRPDKNSADSYYLLSYLLGPEFQNQLQYIVREGAFSQIDLHDLEEILVILPDLAEQRRFALAFAEGRGELDAYGRKAIESRIASISQDKKEFEKLINSLLSDLTSDLDQIHSLDDWLRLKRAHLYDLREIIEREADNPTFYELSIALNDLGRFAEAVALDRATYPKAVKTTKQMQYELFEFRDTINEESFPPFIRGKLATLEKKLNRLMKAESVPPNVNAWLEQDIFPVGTPVQIRLGVRIDSSESIQFFEIIPALSSGNFIETPYWRIGLLEGTEIYSFSASVLFDTPGMVHLDCAIRFVERDGGLVEQKKRLGIEAVHVADVPFAPIHPNPYITGGAVDTPEMFFGRQDVLDYLRSNLIGQHQSNVITLQGNRRTGKTSILKQAINTDLFAPDIPVYVDCQGLGTLTDQNLFYKLAREIWRSLRNRGIASLPMITREIISEEDPFYDFKEALDQMTSLLPGRRIILLIDEFELIDQGIQEKQLSPVVLENLRHLFQHRSDLAVVLTGSYRLKKLSREYWSALFGLGLMHNIGFLDEDAARKLISQPLINRAVYSDEAVDRILQLTACHPYFVQMVCHDLVNELNKQRTVYITPPIVEDAAQETLTSAEGHLRYMIETAGSTFHKAVIVFLASSLTAGRPGEPLLLPGYEIEKFVGEYHLRIERHELEEVLRELSERDLIAIQGEMGQRLYRFKIDLVRQWIRRNYDLQSAIRLAQGTPYVRE